MTNAFLREERFALTAQVYRSRRATGAMNAEARARSHFSMTEIKPLRKQTAVRGLC
jgi:hypothetical protein